MKSYRSYRSYQSYRTNRTDRTYRTARTSRRETLRQVLMHKWPRLRLRIAKLDKRQIPLRQLRFVSRRCSQLNPRDHIACANFVSAALVEHHARGVVDHVVGFLAAGAEVDG